MCRDPGAYLAGRSVSCLASKEQSGSMNWQVHIPFYLLIMLLGIYSINTFPHGQSVSCARQQCL